MKPEIKIKTEATGETSASLYGNLTIRFAKEIKSLFLQLANETITTLEIEKPEAIDLSFVQALWAYRKQVAQQGKKVNISWLLMEADEQLLIRTGFGGEVLRLLTKNNNKI